MAVFAEPEMLTNALTSSGSVQAVSPKIFDGLVAYDDNFRPVPQLALAWQVSPDGLAIRFELRPNVTWHDGQPFTSADVAFSVLEVWRKYHSRGRSTYANVIAAETPDPLTVIWRLSKPAPYILSALTSYESQVLPKHLYEGTDIPTNPHNLAPVGTGPFRFSEWRRGELVSLERYPHYWDAPRPYLDRLIFRVIADSATAEAALETGDVQLLSTENFPLDDISRIEHEDAVGIDRKIYKLTTTITALEFNLDRPRLGDVRVRRAIAHAVDRDFIASTIYHGFAEPLTGPLPSSMAPFYTPDVPLYPFDPAKAEALLDEAGLKRDGHGERFGLTLDFYPAFARVAEYLRSALVQVGIVVQPRNQDFATFIRRVYTDRDFDTFLHAASSGPDPAIGTQRFYWSKNFQPGVAFSNGAHYASPKVDQLLEAAQVEIEPAKRIAIYQDFQRAVTADLPKLPLVAPFSPILYEKRLQDYGWGAEGLSGNFSHAFLTST